MNRLTKFDELGLSPDLMRAINKMGFEEATPIQAATIPVSLEGHDIIGQAQTGTGKTAAFGVPLIQKIDMKNDAIQAIIIAPTRELAIQVSEELYRIGSTKRVRVLSIYGGQDIDRQIRALKKYPHVIVGTPGRLLDHINRRTLKLQTVQTVVLDEADEMLNMGFIEDIESILSNIEGERQTLLFSATMPAPIRRIAERFMKEPKLVQVKSKELTVPNIDQFYLEVQEKRKFDVLTHLLDVQCPELAIIFGRTKRRVDELSDALNMRGYSAEGIHGDLSQAKRLSVLRKFKENSIDILVATDVAARGLDISGVTHVYNFDIPQDPESYVHRVGRTGRAGKMGVAVTFASPREHGQIANIERLTKRKMERMRPPTLDEALEGQQKVVFEKLLETIAGGNLSSYKNPAEGLLEEHDSLTLVAACLKMLTKEPDRTPIALTEEPPVVGKDRKRQGGGGYNGGNGGRKGGSGGSYNQGGASRSRSSQRPQQNRRSASANREKQRNH